MKKNLLDYFPRSTKLSKRSKRDDDFVGPGTSTDSIADANDTNSVSCLLPTEITTVITESQDSSSMSHTTGSTIVLHRKHQPVVSQKTLLLVFINPQYNQ